MQPTAIITGASRGLGEVLAGFLAGDGYDLVISARGMEALDLCARKAAQFGGHVIALQGDIADPSHRQQLADAAQELGGLDLLVNNASSLGPSPLPELVQYPLAELERVFAVNVLAPLGLIQVVLPLLVARKGLIVNLSSDAAVGGYPGWGGYGATKASLDLLTKTLAEELRPRGVSAVSVDPGDMKTRMHQRAHPGEDISDRPPPEITLPFWAWLLGQERETINGRRFEAQADLWEVHR